MRLRVSSFLIVINNFFRGMSLLLLSNSVKFKTNLCFMNFNIRTLNSTLSIDLSQSLMDFKFNEEVYLKCLFTNHNNIESNLLTRFK